jgi:hypothetical protein
LCLDSFRAKVRLGDWPLCQRAKRLPRFSQPGAGQVPAPDPFPGLGLLHARLWCAHRTAPVSFCLLHFWRCLGHRSSLWFVHPAGACVLSPICGLQSNRSRWSQLAFSIPRELRPPLSSCSGVRYSFSSSRRAFKFVCLSLSIGWKSLHE